MKLKKVLKNIPVKEIKGSSEIEITGICSNSKLVSPGNLFIARKGKSDNGEKYIPESIASGAVAVLTDFYNPSLKNITQVIHQDAASIESLIAANYYQFPSDELFTVGITGTNGKTTTSYLVKYLLDSFSFKSGLIGTIEYVIGDHRYPAIRTTPDVIQNQKMLREMRLQGALSAVMEVSSHALDQNRVEYIDYDVVIFTNLTLDHLDYHGSMDEYAKAKNKIFSSQNHNKAKKKVAVFNADSSWYEEIKKGCTSQVITYGIESDADLKATDIQLFPSKTTFNLHYKDKVYACKSPLIGRYNVYNYLAAISVGLVKKIAIDKLILAMEQSTYVPGRLELVKNPLNRTIYVDFAHSDDALENVLNSLTELKKNRIITVFGCGGDRDRFKRPKMAAVSEKFSEMTIVTSDNPRSENPEEILKEIVKGFKKTDSYEIEPDRYLAIDRAIEISGEDDIILIAGKGHETYQIFAHTTIEFDDRKVAYEIASKKLG